MRSGEPLERDPSGDDGEGSETTTSGEAEADPSMFMTVSGVESIAMNETKKDVMLLLMPKRKRKRKRKRKGKCARSVWRSLGAAYVVNVNATF